MSGEARAGVESGTVEFDIRLPIDNPPEGTDVEFRSETNQILLERHFNYARCLCAQQSGEFQGDVDYTKFQVALEGSYQSNSTPEARLEVGSDCTSQDYNEDNRAANCRTIQTIGDLDAVRGDRFLIALNQFMFTEGSCREDTGPRRIWLTFDDDGNSRPDDTHFETEIINIDSEPPPVPEKATVEPGENAAVIEWKNSESRNADIKHYQVLCVEEGDDEPVFSKPKDDPEYESALQLCGDESSVAAVHWTSLRGYSSAGAFPSGAFAANGDGGVPDAGMVDAGTAIDAGSSPDPDTTLPAALQYFDPKFICGTATGTAEEMRISGLKNDVNYSFVLLVIDDAGNFAAVNLGNAQPRAVIDFWEEYQRNGGSAEGGVCLVTSTFGDDHWFTQTLRDFRDRTLAHFALGRAIIEFYYDHVGGLGRYAETSTAARIAFIVVLSPLVGVAALWEYTGPAGKLILVGLLWLVRWRRKRRRKQTHRSATARRRAGHREPWRLGLATGAACVCLFSPTGSAVAQNQFDPYWEEFQPVEEQTAVEPSHWNFGFKIGPYQPDIDS
ncbi:MAG: hypothetical protein MJE77_35360, partial [Proteobacteria bacterium]|nr:hypothetical protein [Pseudomonadota bacterium]